MKYWAIKWNAKAKGAKRSSRMFRTFFGRPELFEAYGYGVDVELFEQVGVGNKVFCYQKDEGKIVGLCEVKAIEDEKQNGVGGKCLVLRTKISLLPGSPWRWPNGRRNITDLSEEEVEAIFEKCGLKRPAAG